MVAAKKIAKTKRRGSGPLARRSTTPATAYAAQIAALDAAQDNVTLDVDGESLQLTRLEKSLWPADERAGLNGYSRRDYIRYLLRVGAYMLPHLRDRPLTLIRMPNGIT